jgi:hypothetical protein
MPLGSQDDWDCRALRVAREQQSALDWSVDFHTRFRGRMMEALKSPDWPAAAADVLMACLLDQMFLPLPVHLQRRLT